MLNHSFLTLSLDFSTVLVTFCCISVYCKFYNCTGLTYVTIGNSVTSIGVGAFGGCTSLASVTCLAEKVPHTGSDTFNGSRKKNPILYVPSGSLHDYAATAPWRDFVILPIEETAINKVTTDDLGSTNTFSISGIVVIDCDNGIVINNGKKYIRK